MENTSSPPATHKRKIFPTLKPYKKTFPYAAIYLYPIACFLLIIIIQSLLSNAIIPSKTQNSHKEDLIFHPLKNPKVPPYTDPNRTWFMSTLKGQAINGLPEHFIFPSKPPHNRILCIKPHDKSYSLATAGNTIPANTTVLKGLTFIADSFYDYENPWHSLNSLSVFFSWMMESGCRKPKRFVVFKNGEVVKKVGDWILSLLRAALRSDEVRIDGLEGYGVACFEKAVVFRRGLGKMSSERRHRLFEMLRCKAWKFCDVMESREREENPNEVRVALVVREGKRSFKNESGVRMIMQKQCESLGGCRLKVLNFKNMSFCDQVTAMRNTDVLASVHGAQLTNMMFMSRGSSIMEMYPKGWLKGAGIGQYIYRWFADWSEMRYKGAWRDTEGPECWGSKWHHSNCFLFQKDQQVGLNETYLAEWTARVILDRMKPTRTGPAYGSNLPPMSKFCACDDH